MYLTTQGLVLRTTEYQDTDLMLTVLTKDRGLMSLRARGVRKNSSRLKSACQLLSYSEFTVFENRGYHTVNEAAPVEMFPELRSDLELLALGSYFAQAAEVLSQEDAPESEILSLTLNSLYALCRLKKPALLVKAAFELRLACLSGYAPQLDGCAVCGNETPDRFNVTGGVLQCARCGGIEGLRLPLTPAMLAAMRYLAACEPKKLFSFSVETEELRQLSDLTETYLATQLERGFSALDFYKSLLFT